MLQAPLGCHALHASVLSPISLSSLAPHPLEKS